MGMYFLSHCLHIASLDLSQLLIPPPPFTLNDLIEVLYAFYMLCHQHLCLASLNDMGWSWHFSVQSRARHCAIGPF